MKVLTTAPRSPQVPRLDPSHEAWLRAEHVRWAHTQLRRLRRAEAEGAVAGARRGQGGQADPPEAGDADEIEAPPRDEACDEADETRTSARDEADETRTSARDEACDETRTSADAAEEGQLSAVTSTVAPAPPPPSPHPQGHDQRRGEHDQRRGEHGQRRRKRRKNKGFLAPGGAGDEWAMGLAECRAAAELRERLGVPAGECPSLEQLQRRLPELLSALHDPADSGAE